MTLPRFFILTMAALAAVTGILVSVVIRSTSTSILQVGEASRTTRAAEVAVTVDAELSLAERAIDDFERAFAEGLVDPHDLHSLERYLTTVLITTGGLTDLTFTAAILDSYDAAGDAVLAPAGREQISISRERNGAIRRRAIENGAAGSATDPTLHDTFRAAAHREARGQALWSDLAFSELDADLPTDRRRKTLTVQKAVVAHDRDGGKRFLGVLRAGILSESLDRIGTQPVADHHRVFLCDDRGRLITKVNPGDHYATLDGDGTPDPDGDVRVLASVLPPEMTETLKLAHDGIVGGRRIALAGVGYYATLVPVAPGRAQHWLVGIVVPERVYIGALASARDRLLVLLGLTMLVLAVVGVAGARVVGRGVKALVASTEDMRRFRFDPSPAASPFAEVRAALASVERAKTALRAMVKYVPVDLVRKLYDSGRDPVLGAELCEVSVMFTDIADFTTHAESLSPAALAQTLGRYLDVATRSVEAHGGTVDKFIGDALMVLWNVPSPTPQHPVAACRAALACASATSVLVRSEWWQMQGLSPWRTRFGIHCDRVLVGNFGAPARLNYTAMGDGVNLASRLEGLNKIYGTTILVSGDVREQVGEAFVLREVDRVAVKGKYRAVSIYELVGHAGDPVVEARRPALAVFERALHAAFARRFTDALEILTTSPALQDDGPTHELRRRLETWLRAPPPADWDGTWTATSK